MVGTAGAHSRAQKCRVAPIASLPSWLQAWGTFAEVLSGVSPRLAPHLWRYQSFIVRSSQRFKEHAWLQYDLFFRRKMALDPSLSWSAIDNELVASCLSADTIRSQLACFACGESSHLASECPGRQAALPDAACFICKEPGHFAKACPHLASGFTPKTSTFAASFKPPPTEASLSFKL